jgi:hypothetical protein
MNTENSIPPNISSPQNGLSAPAGDDLRRYDILIGQLRFENLLLWNRIGFMLIAQAALLGFFATTVDKINNMGWCWLIRVICLMAFPAIGLSLWQSSA